MNVASLTFTVSQWETRYKNIRTEKGYLRRLRKHVSFVIAFEMKTELSWKILIPFLLVPIFSLFLFFGVYIKAITRLYVPAVPFFGLAAFGLLGFWIFYVALLRAKSLSLEETTFQVKHTFTRKAFDYSYSDIQYYSLTTHWNRFSSYRIFQFRTSDERFHAIISYEIEEFDTVVQRFIDSGIAEGAFSVMAFLKYEYLRPLIFAGLTVTVLLAYLAHIQIST